MRACARRCSCVPVRTEAIRLWLRFAHGARAWACARHSGERGRGQERATSCSWRSGERSGAATSGGAVGGESRTPGALPAAAAAAAAAGASVGAAGSACGGPDANSVCSKIFRAAKSYPSRSTHTMCAYVDTHAYLPAGPMPPAQSPRDTRKNVMEHRSVTNVTENPVGGRAHAARAVTKTRQSSFACFRKRTRRKHPR
jgi:hypothetical protein